MGKIIVEGDPTSKKRDFVIGETDPATGMVNTALYKTGTQDLLVEIRVTGTKQAFQEYAEGKEGKSTVRELAGQLLR